MIGFSTGEYKDIGHSAVVESVSGNSITVIEANYTAGQITRRTATGTDLADAARQLGIAGYYRP
jgi:surface antigen